MTAFLQFLHIASYVNPSSYIDFLIGLVIGNGIIYVSSWVLVVAGGIFNWALTETVIQFGQFVNQDVLTAINIIWSVFRDISNIVIIGMFTFIAIMTILGNTEYGYKKMLSRVLIVAVLINFSLLFTKIIIDFSNFTADQFFSAAGCTIRQGPCGSNTASASISAGKINDVAGAFLLYAGANHFDDTENALSTLGHSPGTAGFLVLLNGIVIGFMELITAMILIYGSFLLITRGILLIFLMSTSSIAFASYLIPSESARNFGWSSWWQALVKNALFAPLLAILLWATLTVAKTFKNDGAGSIGDLISKPGSHADIIALFGYFIVIGLLFLSFRVSSSFASSAGGLKFGQGLWNRMQGGAQSGLMGAGRLFGQQTVGRAAYNREKEMTKAAVGARAAAVQARLYGNTGAAEKAEKAAERNARAAIRAGQFSGGYKKTVQERSKKVADILQKSAPSKEMRDAQAKAASETKRAATDSVDRLEDSLKKSQESSTTAMKTISDEIQNGNPALKAEYNKNSEELDTKHTDSVASIDRKYADLVRKTSQEISRVDVTDAHKDELTKQLIQGDEAHKSELRHEGERVEKARLVAILRTANSEAAQELMAKNETFRNAAITLSTADKEQGALKILVDHQKGVASALPGREGHAKSQIDSTNAMIDRISARKFGLFEIATGKSNDVADATRKQLKVNDSTEASIKKMIAAIKSDADTTQEAKK